METMEQVHSMAYGEKIRSFLMEVSGFSALDILKWMHTPNPDWKGFSAQTMISVGKGEQVLDYLSKSAV